MEQTTTADGSGKFTTSVLLVQAPCFALSPILPLQGSSTDSDLTLESFVVNGQFVTITAEISGAGGTLNGSYKISGGCADGEAGDLAGTRIATVNGNYNGPLSGSAGQTVQAALKQSTQSNADGTFLLAGSAMFSGFSCFTKGSIVPGAGSGFVSGSSLYAVFATDEAGGSTLNLSGTVDPAASRITFTSQISGGRCNGQTGGGVLVLTQ